VRLRSRPAAILVLLAVALASPVRAEDGPDLPRPVPPPRPEIGGLLDRLLSTDGEVRASAAAALGKASPDVLRILLFAMRDRTGRAERAAQAAAGKETPEEPDAKRSDRGVAQEARFLEVGTAVAVRLLGAPEAAADAVHRLLPAAEASALVAALAAETGLTTVAAPRITAYDRQKASIEILDQGSYVADVEIREQGGSAIADPVVETWHTGLRLQTRARILHDGTTVAAGLDLDLRRRVDPMAEESLPTNGAVPSVKVQRPEIVGWEWSRTFTVPASRTLVVTFPAGFGAGPGRRLVLLYTPSIVALDEGVPTPAAPDAPGMK
jgi:hypothetical protein